MTVSDMLGENRMHDNSLGRLEKTKPSPLKICYAVNKERGIEK